MSGEKIPPPPPSAPAAAVVVAPPERRAVRFMGAVFSGAVNGLAFCGWALPLLFLWAGLDGGSRTLELSPAEETRVMATTLGRAVDFYLMETGGRFPPVRPAPAAGRDADTDTSRASGLTADLLGKGPGRVREQDFLDGFPQAKPDPETPTGWRRGLVWEERHYAVYDAWGGWFRARLDTDGDGWVENPDPAQAAGGNARLRRKVIFWSAGKDGDWETWGDNIMSGE